MRALQEVLQLAKLGKVKENNSCIPDDLLNEDNGYFQITKKALIEWLVTPKDKRKVKTAKELANLFGVSRNTISVWKNSEEVKEAVFKRKKQIAGVDDLPRVIDALTERAMATNPDLDWKAANKASEIFLEWVGSMDNAKDEGVLKDLIRFTESIKE